MNEAKIVGAARMSVTSARFDSLRLALDVHTLCFSVSSARHKYLDLIARRDVVSIEVYTLHAGETRVCERFSCKSNDVVHQASRS